MYSTWSPAMCARIRSLDSNPDKSGPTSALIGADTRRLQQIRGRWPRQHTGQETSFGFI